MPATLEGMALELLSPARNADMGLLALRCGADAVYIGGPAFGARRGAGNAVAEVARLAGEAHRLGARVYATLNTILFDDELEAARRTAWELHGAGVDALIVQDMAFLEMDLPPIPLHASTQAVCDGPDRVAFLAAAGFSRAILARELSLEEILTIHGAVDPGFELEAFVFGALCVGESGRCGLSQAMEGRSGNRGQCAQPCRRGWDLVDGEGRVLLADRPLLSIRDLDLTDHLEALADAGVRSLKIEGRMKDADYLKNAVGHVRRRLDALLTRRPDLGRPSGVDLGFEPDPRRTFHRGHGIYRLDGQRRPLLSGAASGWLGEPMGVVVAREGACLRLNRVAPLALGDVLSWPGPSGRVVTSTVGAVEGARVTVRDAGRLEVGDAVHRTQDRVWLEALRSARPQRPPAEAAPPAPPRRASRDSRPLPSRLDFRWNIANDLARRFFARHGVVEMEPALELQEGARGKPVMTTRLCLKFEFGQCPRSPRLPSGPPVAARVEPQFLEHEGHRYRCTFDCDRCVMTLVAEA